MSEKGDYPDHSLLTVLALQTQKQEEVETLTTMGGILPVQIVGMRPMQHLSPILNKT